MQQRGKETPGAEATPSGTAAWPARPLVPPRAGSHPLLNLQQTIGNRAVQRLLQSGRVQPELRVGSAGDQCEREADRVASHIMRMPAPTLQPIRAEEGKPVRGRRATAGNAAMDLAAIVVQDVLRSHGQPLAPSVRAFFEPRFGYDLSQVRIHTDARAAESARAVNAVAYTVGRDVVFGAGQYRPTEIGSMRLLAHELTHILQQGAQALRRDHPLDVSAPSDPAEQEAEDVAGNALGIQRPVLRDGKPVRIMRQTNGASAAISAASDKEQMAQAETIRHATLLLALYHLSSVERAVTSGMDQATLLETFPNHLAAIRQWLNTTPADVPFLQSIKKAQELMWKNIRTKTFKVRAAKKAYPLCQTSLGFSFGTPSSGIYMCDDLFDAKSRQCRAEALTHEYFHLVGIGHGEDKKNKVPAAGTAFPTDQALNSAHHMTELTFQLAGGVENTLGCDKA